MTLLSLLDAIERPSILGPDHDHDHHAHELAPVGGAPTLDDLLTDTWDALTSGRAAACPLCEAPLVPRYASGPAPVGGRCTRCGTELS